VRPSCVSSGTFRSPPLMCKKTIRIADKGGNSAYGTATVQPSSSPLHEVYKSHQPEEQCGNAKRPTTVGRRHISYASIVLWVETIRIPSAELRGPPGPANASNDGCSFNTSMNLEIKQQQSCLALAFLAISVRVKLLLNCDTQSQRRLRRQPP